MGGGGASAIAGVALVVVGCFARQKPGGKHATPCSSSTVAYVKHAMRHLETSSRGLRGVKQHLTTTRFYEGLVHYWVTVHQRSRGYAQNEAGTGTCQRCGGGTRDGSVVNGYPQPMFKPCLKLRVLNVVW